MKNNLKKIFHWRNSFLEHDNLADFHLSCWQQNRTVLPLLLFRAFLFACTLGIVIYSVVASAQSSLGISDYWLIYLTHWGLLLVLLSTGAATAVSTISYIKGPFVGDAAFGLPWYVRLFWLIYNCGITIAFVITVFYWAFLSGAYEDLDFAVNKTLDIFIHAINSVIMFLLLMTSRHPSRFLHVYQPVLFAIIYMFFSLFYYLAGGTDPIGNNYIYPMLAWDSPGITMIAVVGTAVLIIVLHIVVAAMAAGRDALAKKLGIYTDASFDIPTGY